jgi:carbon-monoxide dehydrogenase large subunit
VSGRYVQQRLIPSAIEPRAVVVNPEPATGNLTVYTSTQVPHFVKDILAIMCGVSDTKLRVVAPDVGGGFGGKLNVYAEEALALALARRLKCRSSGWRTARRTTWRAPTAAGRYSTSSSPRGATARSWA